MFVTLSLAVAFLTLACWTDFSIRRKTASDRYVNTCGLYFFVAGCCASISVLTALYPYLRHLLDLI